jgi:hypothetical protein
MSVCPSDKDKLETQRNFYFLLNVQRNTNLEM